MAHLIPTATVIQNPLITKRPKPIFVMRFRSSIGDGEFNNLRDALYQSELSKEYHIIASKNEVDRDDFEMYNADKIERQDWNELINKITK